MRESSGLRAATETVNQPGPADSVSRPGGGDDNSESPTFKVDNPVFRIGDHVIWTPEDHYITDPGQTVAPLDGVITAVWPGSYDLAVDPAIEDGWIIAYRHELAHAEPEPFAFEVGDRVLVIKGGESDFTPLVGSEGTVVEADRRDGLWEHNVRVELDSGIFYWYRPSELVPEPIPYVLTETVAATSWQQQIVFACDDLADLLIAKRSDYGPDSYTGSPWGWEVALLTRLHEKVARLVHIQKNDSSATFENMAEAFGDIAGIAILAQVQTKES